MIAIAAVLYVTRYVAAAIFGSSLHNWNSNLFNAMLEYVGTGPVIWSIVTLIAGIIYLVSAETEEFLKPGK